MPLFHVTFTKEIEVMVEADSLEECKEAAEKEANDHRLQDYVGGDWIYFLYDVSTRNGFDPPEPDNGVGPDGLMANISDARREKRTAKLKSMGQIQCPDIDCGYIGDAEEFVVAEGYRPAVAFCPECRKPIDPDDILSGAIVLRYAHDSDDRTIDMFEVNNETK